MTNKELHEIEVIHSVIPVFDSKDNDFELWYQNYIKRPNEGLSDYHGNKIVDKEYLFKRFKEEK